MLETIRYFVQNGSFVFVCFLHFTKAFDTVNYAKLYDVLSSRGIDTVFLRAIFRGYLAQSAKIDWNGCFSNIFQISNGVRQGGILSPYFFACYLDGITQADLYNGMGCWFGTCFAGVVAYADDVVLLCPSLHGLRFMLEKANDFASSLDLNFNPSKSAAVRFGSPFLKQFSLSVNGEQIPWKNNVIHLGFHISCDLSDEMRCSYLVRDFFLQDAMVCSPHFLDFLQTF